MVDPGVAGLDAGVGGSGAEGAECCDVDWTEAGGCWTAGWRLVIWNKLLLVVGGVGGGGCEIEPVSGGVDSTKRSVAGELKSAPESELETVGSRGHLHKIGREIPSTEDSIHSSTSIQGQWESVPGTWHKCQVENENQQFKM